MKEIFKPVVGYEGLYEVSNLGRVKCLEKTGPNPITKGIRVYPEKIMKTRTDRDGYTTIGLNDETNGRKKKYSTVHRLVAKAFLPNPENRPEVNHKDHNRSNNELANLEWSTLQENRAWCVKFDRQIKGEQVNTCKLTEAQVLEILSLKNSLTQKQLGEKYGVTQSAISSLLLGKSWKSVKSGVRKIKNHQYRHGK